MIQDELAAMDFSVDTTNLYREEGFTDLTVASIRRLTPVHPDGSDDRSRTPIFIGSTQLMTPEGPLPIQAALTANSLEEAYTAFPEAMKKAVREMVAEAQRIRRENDSRIVVPGRP